MATIRFGDRTLDVAPGATVLDTLEAAGVTIPNACRSGVCQSCRVRAVTGTPPEAAQAGLGPGPRALGHFLACVAHPTGDLEVATLDASAELPVTLAAVRREGAILIVHLRPQPMAGRFFYEAGQFITLLRDDGLARPYSLASLPSDELLELHVRHYPGGAMSGWLATAAVGSPLRIRGPFGTCFYLADDRACPLLLVGAGTGLAPLSGITRAALRAGHQGPIVLLHGARRASDLYYREELAALAADHPNLEVVASALEIDSAADAGLTATPLDTLARARATALGHHDLRAYLCGAPPLVQGLRRRLFLDGVAMRSILADAFLPAAAAT